jgi:drug/metabolite transporter (DMT)-like permease
MKTPSTERRLGFAALVAAAFTYGSWGVLSRIIGADIPLFYQNTFRSVLAVIVYVLILRVRPGVILMPAKDLFWVGMRTVFGLTAIAAFVYGIRLIPFGTFYFIFYAGQVLSGYILGLTLFAEKITRVKTLSFLLAVTGLILLYNLKLTGATAASLFIALLCGVSTSAWNTLSKKISGTYTAFELGYADNFWGILLGSMVSLILKEQWSIPVVNAAWAANAIFGLTSVATGAFVVYGFKRMEATVGSIVMLTEILFGVAFGYFLYSEHLSLQSVIGGLIVLTAVVLPEIARNRSGTIRSTPV